jgi:Transposase DDE domain
VKLPIRWPVERTFARQGRYRRLSKDHEETVLSSEVFVKLVMIQLMLHRLRPSDVGSIFGLKFSSHRSKHLRLNVTI